MVVSFIRESEVTEPESNGLGLKTLYATDWFTHPDNWHEASKIFPLMPEQELLELAEDIRANGLSTPITTFEDKLLDGRNRALACKLVGTALIMTQWVSCDTTATSWVISQNLHRRHLTASQKAAIALEIGASFFNEAKERQKHHGGTAPGRARSTSPRNGGSDGESQKLAAKTVGVSHGYVAELKKLVTADPSLLPQVKDGSLTISAARQRHPSKKSSALHGSNSEEWYTPEIYIRAARKVLGVIDIDPASCQLANNVVQATQYFSREDDGLSQEWQGQVWMNPPYGRLGPKFMAKMIRDYQAGKVHEAIILLSSNSVDTKWFEPLFDCVVCFTNHRPKFWNAETISTSRPTHGGVFVYMGKSPNKFEDNFKQFGAVLNRFKG